MISSWALYTQRIDMQSVYVCSFLKFNDMYWCIVCTLCSQMTVISIMNYLDIQVVHDMYVMKYVCMLSIYISQVSMKSHEIRYIYKVHYEE